MSDTSESSPPEGWYSDPAGSGQQRRWDGNQWTQEMRPDPEAPPPPPTDLPTTVVPPIGEPQQPGWWSRSWKWVVAGSVGFVIGAVAGAGGSSETTTTTVTEAGTATTVTAEAKTVTEKAKAKTVTAAAAPAQPASGSGSSGGDVQTFEGNGGKSLGTLNIDTDSKLEWTNDGDVFTILTEGPDPVPVNSQANSGDTILSAGTYPKFQVNAIGNWTIKITPQ